MSSTKLEKLSLKFKKIELKMQELNAQLGLKELELRDTAKKIREIRDHQLQHCNTPNEMCSYNEQHSAPEGTAAENEDKNE